VRGGGVTLLARVFEEVHGDVELAVVDGELDASNAVEIGERLRGMLNNRSTALVLDLTTTSYLDSAAINMVFKLSGALGERQQTLHLVIPPGAPMARALAITGLDAAVPTHPTREQALERAGA
jgi:anti-anti-sigma factor